MLLAIQERSPLSFCTIRHGKHHHIWFLCTTVSDIYATGSSIDKWIKMIIREFSLQAADEQLSYFNMDVHWS